MPCGDRTRFNDAMRLLSFDDAREAVRRLVEVSEGHGEPIGSPIVLVGGSAMAAWQVRAHSKDVDLFTSSASAEVVEQVEHELRTRFGAAFRLDVTTTENIRGSILLRDITSSPLVETLASGHDLRALSIRDLFLVKLASGRDHDRSDLVLLAPKTTVDDLVARWNQLVKWHGDRAAILGYADAFLAELVRLYSVRPLEVIERLALTTGQRDELRAAHGGAHDAR